MLRVILPGSWIETSRLRWYVGFDSQPRRSGCCLESPGRSAPPRRTCLRSSISWAPSARCTHQTWPRTCSGAGSVRWLNTSMRRRPWTTVDGHVLPIGTGSTSLLAASSWRTPSGAIPLGFSAMGRPDRSHRPELTLRQRTFSQGWPGEATPSASASHALRSGSRTSTTASKSSWSFGRRPLLFCSSWISGASTRIASVEAGPSSSSTDRLIRGSRR